MELIFLIVLICVIYQIFWGIPNQIKMNDDKIEILKLHLKQINIKLDQINDKLNQKQFVMKQFIQFKCKKILNYFDFLQYTFTLLIYNYFIICLGGKRMINKIGKITLYVNNQEEAKKFWTEKLNFVVKFEQAMGPTMKWIEVGPSADEFTTFVLYDKNLMKAQNPATNVEHPSILLSTSDIESSYEEMKSKDVEVGELMKMPYGKMFSFKDQDGNQYLLREDKY